MDFMNLLQDFLQAVSNASWQESFGGLFGIAGAYMLAKGVRWGWIAFLISNACMIMFAISIKANGFLVMQIVFLGTTVIGLRKHFLVKKVSPTAIDRVPAAYRCWLGMGDQLILNLSEVPPEEHQYWIPIYFAESKINVN